MFDCKNCSEKDCRIQDLKEEIKFLREMLFPKKIKQDVSDVNREVDALWNGSEEIVDISNEAREASMILSGEFPEVN